MQRSFDVSITVCFLLAGASTFAQHAKGPDELRGVSRLRESVADIKSDDPDELYRRREDLLSAKRAAAIWSATADTDFTAAWKLARTAYWLGTHAAESERRAALERGVTAGEAAVKLNPDRPEGHFWLAADMGALAESFGLSRGLKYRSRIRSELERSMAIDPLWEEASAETALGRWYFEVPRLFGGGRTKAEELFRHVLQRFPQNKNALSFLADVLLARDQTAQAREMLERLIDTAIEPDWAPEDRDFKRKATERLRTLTARDQL
jgi:tetratricopeptide (TPR) repeat protein